MLSSHLTVKVFNTFSSKLPFERVPLLTSSYTYMLMIIKFLFLPDLWVVLDLYVQTAPGPLHLQCPQAHQMQRSRTADIIFLPSWPPRLPILMKDVLIAPIAWIGSEVQTQSPMGVGGLSVAFCHVAHHHQYLNEGQVLTIHAGRPWGQPIRKEAFWSSLFPFGQMSVWDGEQEEGRWSGYGLKLSQATLLLLEKGLLIIFHHLQVRTLRRRSLCKSPKATVLKVRPWDSRPDLLMVSIAFFLLSREEPWAHGMHWPSQRTWVLTSVLTAAVCCFSVQALGKRWCPRGSILWGSTLPLALAFLLIALGTISVLVTPRSPPQTRPLHWVGSKFPTALVCLPLEILQAPLCRHAFWRILSHILEILDLIYFTAIRKPFLS